MQSLTLIDILIGLVICGAVFAVLHAIGTDIRHTYMRIDLTRRVIDRRERYLRELRGEFDEDELGEVEIFEEDNPGTKISEIATEAQAAAAA